jgi:micrococcal nuclease
VQKSRGFDSKQFRRQGAMCAGLILALVLWAGPVSTASAWNAQSRDSLPTHGFVVSIADGDTLTMLDDSKHKEIIRLASIDAPELSHGASEPGQPYSRRAKDALAAWVFRQPVTLTCYERDRYGRAVCDVIHDGHSVGRDLVAAGLAWSNRARPEYLRDSAIPGLEQHARQQRLGLWSSGHPQVPPWVWRKSCWQFHECTLPPGLVAPVN